jgi:hypothetical protein
MKKEILTIEDILNSAEFNEMFDFESEKKEIELSGWNYSELMKFAKQLAKQIN